MTQITTSATFDVWRVVTQRLKDISWPSGGEPDEQPVAVWFGDPDQPQPDEEGNPPHADERVVVVSMVDVPDVNWDTIGQYARMEEWRLPIFVETAVPGKSSIEAATRLEELTGEIELNVRSMQAGQRDSSDRPTEFVKYEIWQLAVAYVKPLILPWEGGYLGQAELMVECRFRINKPFHTE